MMNLIFNNTRPLKGADFFCGAGGFTEGVKQYCAAWGIPLEWVALNHWPVAIETHSANNPFARHVLADIYKANPLQIVPGGYLDLAVMSPACTYHSLARGGGKCDEQSRSQAFELLRIFEQVDVSAIILENVKEFMNWGPLLRKDTFINGKWYKAGTPNPLQKGKYFRKFLRGLLKLGYKFEYRILNSANYGAYTARNRLFLIAMKGTQRINWPAFTNAKEPDDFFVKPWNAAKDIIDWSIPGESIFQRQAGLIKGKSPLCENTIKRICHGLHNISGYDLKPYLVMLYGQSNAKGLDLPLPTITNGNHLALCTPFILHQMTPGRCRTVSEPLPTITGICGHALIQPWIMQYHGGKDYKKRNYSLNDPLPVIDTSNRYALCEPFLTKYYGTGENFCSIHEPLHTVTTKDRFGLVQPIADNELYQFDILYRMLLPHELSAAMGFGANYKFAGNTTEIKKQIGNAVEVHQAYALASAVIPILQGAA